MRIRIVAVGKLKESYWRDSVDEYLSRLRRYVDVSEIELKDESESHVAHAMRKSLSSKWRVVLLTVDGRARSSEEVAAFMEQAAMHGRDLAFVLGGADGIPAEIVAEHKETQ